MFKPNLNIFKDYFYEIILHEFWYFEMDVFQIFTSIYISINRSAT